MGYYFFQFLSILHYGRSLLDIYSLFFLWKDSHHPWEIFLMLLKNSWSFWWFDCFQMQQKFIYTSIDLASASRTLLSLFHWCMYVKIFPFLHHKFSLFSSRLRLWDFEVWIKKGVLRLFALDIIHKWRKPKFPIIEPHSSPCHPT